MAHLSDAQHAAITDLAPELDRLAIDSMADWKVPGAAIAVVQNGEVVLAKAYGQRDIETDLPVTTATQFVMCSITKSSMPPNAPKKWPRPPHRTPLTSTKRLFLIRMRFVR